MTNATKENSTGTAAEAVEKERDYAMVSVSVPLDFETRLKEQAKTENISHTVLARRKLAEAFGYDITEFERTRRRGRVSGLTPEERALANEKAQKERAAVVRILMKKYKGEISEEEIEQEMANAPVRKTRTSKSNK